MPQERAFLTNASDFGDVSRGNPLPYRLSGDALVRARLTDATWRLEIVADGEVEIVRPLRMSDNTALDLHALLQMGKRHGVRFLKALQCNNIARPLGQGLWEGVPLRDVLHLVGKIDNARRVYYWGFHNNDPKQMFRSSLSLSQALDTPPGELPPFVAYRLNGRPIPLERGGPVRMIIPWAHGFKSIKWLQCIVLTNDYRTNDTYAEQNNDPESYLKTAAYIDNLEPETFRAGGPVTLHGTAMVGWPGLKCVEYWLRQESGTHGRLDPADPAWRNANWRPCLIESPPDSWGGSLPKDVHPSSVWGFGADGRPKQWPMRYSVVLWSASLKGLKPGGYEFRVRTVDQNGFAQPEPRPYQKSGKNAIQCKQFIVQA
jgi:DMSO/TMAO reductase YedYZ molybdopterin-dependent catalytic subunit